MCFKFIFMLIIFFNALLNVLFTLIFRSVTIVCYSKEICFHFLILCNIFLLAFLNFGFMLIIIFLSVTTIFWTGKLSHSYVILLLGCAILLYHLLQFVVFLEFDSFCLK